MPLDSRVFPQEIQTAFFIYSLLEDKWDGMSGTYMGKSFSNIEYFFNLYGVTDEKTILFFLKIYDSIKVNHRIQKSEQKRKAEERRAKSKASAGGGKTYTHSVKG